MPENIEIINNLKQSGLTGRSGSCFPTWQKWQMVKDAPGYKKYVIVNGSEGEPGVKKDGFLLEHHADQVIAGLKLAIDYLGNDNEKKPVKVSAYIYLSPEYHKKYEAKLDKLIGTAPIEIFKKSHLAGYVGGEESSLINHIEGNRIEPRLRPPFPTMHGLWRCPTLVNNVETFYAVALINDGKYEHKRFYTINGDCLWTGVYELPETMTIEEILRQTNNYPKFEFFVQVGGDSSGLIYNSEQLKQITTGAGSITVYSILKHKPLDLIRKWLRFYINESCGQCAVCREGVFRLEEILEPKEPNWHLFADILNSLSETSFCGLGGFVPWPLRSYINNIILDVTHGTKLPNIQRLKDNFSDQYAPK